MARVERFMTPPSFEEVNLSEGHCPLDLKDVSKSRKELWLIRAPLGFDGSTLNGVSLTLDGGSVEFCGGEGDSKQYEALSVRHLKENEGQSPYLLLPTPEEGMLEPGPAFKGQIVVMESLSSLPSGKTLPDITPSEVPKIPDGLRQRFKPFGWEKPWQGEESPSSPKGEESPSFPKKSSSPRKKQKVRQENTQNDEVFDRMPQVPDLETLSERIVGEEDSDQELESRKKMKKVKKKHEKKKVGEEESRPEQTDDVADENGASPRKKKKKKKSKDK